MLGWRVFRHRYWMVTFDGTQYAEPVLGYGTHGDVIVMSE